MQIKINKIFDYAAIISGLILFSLAILTFCDVFGRRFLNSPVAGTIEIVEFGVFRKRYFNFFGLIPWDPPSFMIIGIWPILMGASMWVQQKLNPAPADPIQAKIFAFFPLFLTIILASFPSGLVVYWTINNILTIAQQYVIVKKTTVKTN